MDAKQLSFRKLVRWKRQQAEAYLLRDQGLSDSVIAKTLNVNVYQVRGFWMIPRDEKGRVQHGE